MQCLGRVSNPVSVPFLITITDFTISKQRAKKTAGGYVFWSVFGVVGAGAHLVQFGAVVEPGGVEAKVAARVAGGGIAALHGQPEAIVLILRDRREGRTGVSPLIAYQRRDRVVCVLQVVADASRPRGVEPQERVLASVDPALLELSGRWSGTDRRQMLHCHVERPGPQTLRRRRRQVAMTSSIVAWGQNEATIRLFLGLQLL